MAAVHGPPSTKPRLPISQRWHLALRGRLLGARARGARAARCGATRPGAARRGGQQTQPNKKHQKEPARRVGKETHREKNTHTPSSPFASAKTLLLSID